MIDPDDPGTIPLPGMHRIPDHETSIKAAGKVRRFTLREQVIEFAADPDRRGGFIDDDLKAWWPEKPESSLRKRRTELAQENILLDTGLTRMNRHAQEEKVWVHRSFLEGYPGTPPIVERDTTPKQSKLARAEARLADASDIITLCLPYIETALTDPHYKQDGIAALITRIRKFITTD